MWLGDTNIGQITKQGIPSLPKPLGCSFKRPIWPFKEVSSPS